MHDAEVDILQPKGFPEAFLLIYFMVFSLSSFLSMLIVIYHSGSLDISIARGTCHIKIIASIWSLLNMKFLEYTPLDR